MLRHGTKPKQIIGYGSFCSIECAIKKAKTNNYGDSDFFEILSLTLQKYYTEDKIETHFSPNEVKELNSLLEKPELKEAVIPTYQVKKASRNKRSTNDIIKNDFFTGNCEAIMTAKNLCTTK